MFRPEAMSTLFGVLKLRSKENCGSLQDGVDPPQVRYLTFQNLHPIVTGVVGRRRQFSRGLRLLDPMSQHFGMDAHQLPYRSDHSNPLRILPPDVENHANRAFHCIWRILPQCRHEM